MKSIGILLSSTSTPCALRKPQEIFRRSAACCPKASQCSSCDADDASRRMFMSGVFAAGMMSMVGVCQARESGLDIPSCQNFSTAGNLAYCDIVKGSGESPEIGDLIEVNYTARSIATGKVYDGSKNFEFYVGQGEITPGWDEAILGNSQMEPMKEGGQRTVQLPPSMAYGKSGLGCVFGLDDKCRVPPDSSVEVTFQYRGIRG